MENTIKALDELIESESVKHTFGPSYAMFSETYKFIKLNIEEVSSNKELTPHDHNDIYETVRSLKYNVLYEHNNYDTLKFIELWSLVVFNWNENICKSPAISDSCKEITLILNGYLTIREATDLLKIMIERMREFQGWQPPAFEISKHFIDYLDN